MHENARISEKTRMSRRKLRTGWIEGREPGKDRRDSLCRLRKKKPPRRQSMGADAARPHHLLRSKVEVMRNCGFRSYGKTQCD